MFFVVVNYFIVEVLYCSNTAIVITISYTSIYIKYTHISLYCSMVKLADFGVAMKMADVGGGPSAGGNGLEDNPDLAGSPYWMAPEIIEMSTPTSACDIW